MNEVLKQ